MRKAMKEIVSKKIMENKNAALLLVDIGVWPFNELLKKCPERVKNIGIFEAGTVSIAAGLSLNGIVPTIYGISPFIVQRALEQIKLDFIYQELGGNFITTGASYDFSTLGYSHYCAEDMATLKLLPGIEFIAPGTSAQFSKLYEACWNNNRTTYFRMTDYPNSTEVNVTFGKANVIRRGKKCIVLAVAETLDKTIEACRDLDVTILYYTTIIPFDKKTLQEEMNCKKIYIVEPFYIGSLDSFIIDAVGNNELKICESGVPLEILRNYGTKEQKDIYCGLTIKNIKERIENFIND